MKEFHLFAKVIQQCSSVFCLLTTTKIAGHNGHRVRMYKRDEDNQFPVISVQEMKMRLDAINIGRCC